MTEFVAAIPESFVRECSRCMAAALGTGGETFVFGKYQWDVDAARKLVGLEADARKFKMSIVSCRSLLGFIRIDAAHKLHVPLVEPLIVAHTPDGMMPIDGWHRIARALEEGHTTLPAYYLNPEETRTLRLDLPRARAKARRPARSTPRTR